MPIQTSVNSAPEAGFEGMLATYGAAMVVTGKNQSGGAIPFGRFVKDDPSNDQAFLLPSSAADQITGVSLFDPAIEADANGVRSYPDKRQMGVIKQGVVTMIPEQDMKRTDPVFARFTVDGGDSTKSPGRIRKDAGGAAGTKQVSTLTLSGALDGGRARVQKLVLSADLVAADVVTGSIGGAAIAAVTYASSHLSTMQMIVAAIKDALEASGQTYADVRIGGATTREIHLVGLAPSATDLPLTGWTVTAGGVGTAAFASATGADVTAGKAPHELQARLHGDTLYTQGWAGSHDDTVALFAQQLGGDAQVGSAAVTVVPGGADLVITLTALAAAASNPIAIDQNQVNGGATARTLAANEAVVPNVAGSAKAVQITTAKLMQDVLAGQPARVSVLMP
jgi:hypothetical protein